MAVARPPSKGIRAVAERAGVSIASVSRALNSPAAVRPDLRARIAEAAAAIGYTPNSAARALSSRRTRTLGAIVPTIDNTMFARGVDALQKYLSSVGYMLFLTTSGYDLDAEFEQARNLVSRGVDGLVLRGDRHHGALLDLLKEHNVPFVNVGVYRPDRPHATIGCDNEAAAHRAATHLIEIGHRRIGVVSALLNNNDRAEARVEGFRRALRENALEDRADWRIETPYTLAGAREAARHLISLPERPTAVFCGNDVIAYGVLLEAERCGLSIPRDLSVVGFDDLEWSRHLRPSLTTIQVPTDVTWRSAGEYLVNRLAQRNVTLHHEIDFSLVIRESTAPPPKAEHER